MATIEVDFDVEQMCFEPRYEPADGRAQTEVGHAIDAAPGERVVRTVAADPHRIDAEGRPQEIAEAEICRRKTEAAPAPVAGLDAAVDLPEPAEQCRRLARPARLQQLADLGGGVDRLIGAADRLDHGNLKTVRRARLA